MSFLEILIVVAPVFLVIGAGQGALRIKLISDTVVDGLMRYANFLGFPVLLFGAIARLDLGAMYDPKLFASYYSAATISFFLGLLGGRYLLRREWPDAVVIGFGSLFTNGVLLGIPISERALGADALGPNFAIISVHSPFCYALGVTAMEIARSEGKSMAATANSIVQSMMRNPLIVGLSCGFIVNLTGLPIPQVIWDAVDMIARAALPAALVALGGVLTRYHFGRSVWAASLAATISLVIHPAMVFAFGSQVFHLEPGQLNSALLTAAMAPGVNMYVFATLYQRAMGAAASTLILGTFMSVITVSGWMLLLQL